MYSTYRKMINKNKSKFKINLNNSKYFLGRKNIV